MLPLSQLVIGDGLILNRQKKYSHTVINLYNLLPRVVMQVTLVIFGRGLGTFNVCLP